MKKSKFNIPKRQLYFSIKILASVIFLVVLYYKLFKSEVFSFASFYFFSKIFLNNFWLIPLLILLSVINWISDTWVWYRIVKNLNRFSFREVLKVNIISQYLGTVTPFAIGEYGAKMKLFKSIQEKKQSLLITLSYRLSKSLVKVFLGTLAIVFLIINGTIESGVNDYLLLTILLTFFFAVSFFSETIFKWMLKIPFLKSKKEESLLESNHLKVYKTLFPATIKFLSYCIQLSIIIALTNVGFSFFDGFLLAILIYSIGSFLPQLGILDPFVKGSIGLLISPSEVHPDSMIWGTLIVWLLNVGIPSIYGAVIWFISKPNEPESP